MLYRLAANPILQKWLNFFYALCGIADDALPDRHQFKVLTARLEGQIRSMVVKNSLLDLGLTD
jgi:hypothetical protein